MKGQVPGSCEVLKLPQEEMQRLSRPLLSKDICVSIKNLPTQRPRPYVLPEPYSQRVVVHTHTLIVPPQGFVLCSDSGSVCTCALRLTPAALFTEWINISSLFSLCHLRNYPLNSLHNDHLITIKWCTVVW